MTRKQSRKAQFNERIPSHLLGKLDGVRLEIPCGEDIIVKTLKADSTHVVYSLRTDDGVEAIKRKAQAGAYLDAIFTALSQSAPVLLTHRQCVALAGELYRAWASDPDTITPVLSVEVWRNAQGEIERRRTVEPASPQFLKVSLEVAAQNLQLEVDKEGDVALERNLGPLIDKLLIEKGIGSLAVETRRTVLLECFKGLLDGMNSQARKAGGDYRHDPMAERFPAWDAPVRTITPTQLKGEALEELLRRWEKEAQRSASTLDTYRRAFRMLEDHLGHEDSARVTKADIVNFKDKRIAAGLNWKTVNDGDLAAFNSVFRWAVANDLMAANPAQGVKAIARKVTKLRKRSFTRTEASLILSAANGTKRGSKEAVERWAGRRWAPWLMAYTGARVGEILQLRKQDVLQSDGLWCIRITPEAGTVKTGEARTIPLHGHLLEMGFPDYAQAADKEHLFLWRRRNRQSGHPKGIMLPVKLGSAKNEMQDFCRQAAKLEAGSGVQPNHAWRHTFKTIGFEAELEERIMDAINGHAPRSASQGYGEITPKAMARALERFPRFKLA
ncbi:MAG: hypothetical protein Rhims3KO_05910 [Hyphomicrobiales bacterium]